jgi:hypothetical protein
MLPNQTLGHAPTKLCDLEAVGEPIVEWLPVARRNNLSYAVKPPKRTAVKDPISVNLSSITTRITRV